MGGSIIIKMRWHTLEIDPLGYGDEVCITSESTEETHTYYLDKFKIEVLIEHLQEQLNKIN